VLDGGRLVGCGTHEQLRRDCRQYGDFLLTEERREHLMEGHRDGV